MSEQPASPARTFGITASRLRGGLTLLIMGLALYMILFKSDPPPLFGEIEISIPPPPETDFDERSIVLPEFEASPALSEDQPGEGVEIVGAIEQDTLTPEQVEQDELAFATPEGEAAEVEAPPAADAADAAAARQEQPAIAPPPPLEAPADTSLVNRDVYFVQVIATSSRDKGDQLAAELSAKLEVPALVSPVARDGKTLYRVRLGPFGNDKARALNTLARLRELQPATEARVVSE